MKNFVLLILMLFCFFNPSAQRKEQNITTSKLHFQVSRLSNNLSKLNKSNNSLQRTVNLQAKKIDSLSNVLSVTQSHIRQISDSLYITASAASSATRQTQSRIQSLVQLINSRTIYLVTGILLLTGLSLVALFFLRNKLSLSNHNLSSQISIAKNTLELEAIKLDSKLVEILQTQLSILKNEQKVKETIQGDGEHKLPVKVGEEIHRMRKRIVNMPQDVKGLSALNNSLNRLEEEFNDRGYEIEELLGKKYVNGMKMEARFVHIPEIPKGEEIITDVLRPQIKYKGQVIQVAKVEVGKSY